MRRRIGRLLFVLLAGAVSWATVAADVPDRSVDAVTTASARLYPDRPFRIGVIELSDIHRLNWLESRTVQRLKKAFAPFEIHVERMSSSDLEHAVKAGEVDAFIASSGFYWRMIPYGARDVATMISSDRPDPNRTSAITFITRADNMKLRSIADMKGKVLSASYPTAFMGYRIGLAEIAAAGYGVDAFFQKVLFTLSPEIPGIAQRVLTGEADVAFVQACWLESQPESVRRQYRVIGAKPADGFPCVRSTEAYPNITAAVLKSAAPGAAREIARVLLNMPPDEAGERWGLATDFQSVDRVYKLLKLEHYAYLRDSSIKRWIAEHRPWIAAGLFCLLLLILHSFVLSFMVRMRTDELKHATQEKDAVLRHLASLHARMENIRKASIVSQLSNLIAHELAQPVGAARSFCDGMKLLNENGNLTPQKFEASLRGLDRGLSRIQRIVEKVRSYSKGHVARDSKLGLLLAVRTARDSLSRILTENVSISINIPEAFAVLGDQLEIELLFNNLLGNAAAAAKDADTATVSVTAYRRDGAIVVVIENPGRILSNEDMAQLTVPFISGSGPGHGLGVPISLSLAEANGGHLAFEKRSEGGLRALVTLRAA